MTRHIAHYPGQHTHPLLAKTAYISLDDLQNMPTIDPSSGRFRPSNSTKNFNISMDKIEQFFADSVSFDARLSFEERSTITMSCVDTGWSASVDASKDGWAVSLLEKAEAHDEDYMSGYLDRNSDFSGYRASRKTAADRNHFVVNAEFNIYAHSEEKADWVWRDFVFHALSSRQGNPNEHVTIETYSVDKGTRYRASRKTARRSLMWEVAVIDNLNHQEVAIWRQPDQTWQLYVDRQNPDEDVVDWTVVRSGPRGEYEYITEVDSDAVFIDGGQESTIQEAKMAAEDSLFSKTGSRKTAGEKTLDERTLEKYPDEYVAVECYLCGEVAAKPRNDIFTDTMCDECNTRAETIYSQQGGQ